MFNYKIDVLKELSKHGYTSTRMRKEKIMSEATMQNLRKGKGITTDTLNTICIILRCQPSDVLEIVPTDEEKNKIFKTLKLVLTKLYFNVIIILSKGNRRKPDMSVFKSYLRRLLQDLKDLKEVLKSKDYEKAEKMVRSADR